MPAARSTTEQPSSAADRRARATFLVDRYSIELSELLDSALGTSGNAEVQMLLRLLSEGPSRPRELMQASGLSRTNAARVVERLERLGLVQRASGVEDRRTMLTSLTRLGRRRLTDTSAQLVSFFSDQAPVLHEIIDLLDVGGGAAPPSRAPSPTDVLRATADVGSVLAQRIADEVGVVGRSQRIVLGALAGGAAARPGQLAELAGLSSGGATNLLDQMEGEGLIVRTYGTLAGDRRGVLVELAPGGRAAVRRQAAIIDDVAGDLVAALRAALAVG